ncbi:hypothetical protein DFH07DRAFT_923751 [Mycena maculata]|uniref:Uncharacterized protein n=1 Tax=Mycena maculata TaxID=230809 RepID=A0AAD7IP91_9AGAR|nr:hypothetical protein DFH07DRAFT_923751 [Mycena maculata]
MSTRNWLDEDDRDLSQRALSTLSPAHLQHSDYIGLSHWQWPSVCFIPRTPSFSLRFHKKDQTSQPFPKGTRGFLYYYAPPNHLPPMAGGVRFRITPSGNPATFQKGVDLLHDGLPWQIPLHTIACAVGDFEILRKQLLLERLVTQADLDQCLAATPNKKRLDHRTTLYGLNQPFPVAFHRAQSATVVGSAGLKRWSYSYTFADNRMQHRPLARPYAGAALAQFERSPLPQHAGTQTLVLRITKMLAPPTCTLPRYDGYIPPPAEGALVRRPMGHARAVSLQPWHCDVAGASESAAALRMLLENGPV